MRVEAHFSESNIRWGKLNHQPVRESLFPSLKTSLSFIFADAQTRGRNRAQKTPFTSTNHPLPSTTPPGGREARGRSLGQKERKGRDMQRVKQTAKKLGRKAIVRRVEMPRALPFPEGNRKNQSRPKKATNTVIILTTVSSNPTHTTTRPLEHAHQVNPHNCC